LIDEQMGELDKEMASLLTSTKMLFSGWRSARSGVDSAQQIIAKSAPPQRPFLREMPLFVVVPARATTKVLGQLQSPLSKGNRHMRRLLNQAANAGSQDKGSISRRVSRLGPSPGHNQAIGPSPIDSVD